MGTTIKNCVSKHNDLKIATKSDVKCSFTLGEIAKGYKDNSEEVAGGVTAMDGKLNIRPKYQRAFIRETDKVWRCNLVDSVLNERPIGSFYFADKGEGYYDVLDGQQRLMTLCSVINAGCNGTITINDNGVIKDVAFPKLRKDWQEKIKNYEIDVYICVGNEEGLLNWFTTINQPHSELTKQEIRNAVYCGPFVEDAKRLFSKTRAKAQPTSEFQTKSSPYYFDKFSHGLKLERQDFLERVIDWASMIEYGVKVDRDIRIDNYMSEHRNDENAECLVEAYKKIVDWACNTFRDNVREQKGVRGCDWGEIYTLFAQKEYDFKQLNDEIEDLLLRDSIIRTSNILKYALMGKQDNAEDEHRRYKLLSVRGLTPTERKRLYKMQGGIDPIDGKTYDIDEMQAHHIRPVYAGGETKLGNMVLLSAENHRRYHYEGICTAEQLKEKYEALVQKNGYVK